MRATQPLFDCARELGVGFYLGYAELAVEGGVDASLQHVDPRRQGGPHHRQVPQGPPAGPRRARAGRPFQNLEKRYFEVGNLGFPVLRAFGGIVGMAICNDRRWPETYRVLGLQGVEMVVLGYNTPVHNPPSPEHDHLAHFHNQLVDAGGRLPERLLGRRRGQGRRRGRRAPDRQLDDRRAVGRNRGARASTEGDELAIARCDLDLTLSYKNTTFNFAMHRQPRRTGSSSSAPARSRRLRSRSGVLAGGAQF